MFLVHSALTLDYLAISIIVPATGRMNSAMAGAQGMYYSGPSLSSLSFIQTIFLALVTIVDLTILHVHFAVILMNLRVQESLEKDNSKKLSNCSTKQLSS
jgi:hypothetical protein